MSPEPTDRAGMVSFFRAHPLAVVATTSVAGAPEAALLSVAALPTGDLLFDCETDSRKAQNLNLDPRIAVVIGTAGSVSVQLEGTATATRGARRRRLAAEYEAQLGPSRALAPGYELFLIEPTWLRVYDSSTSPARVTESQW